MKKSDLVLRASIVLAGLLTATASTVWGQDAAAAGGDATAAAPAGGAAPAAADPNSADAIAQQTSFMNVVFGCGTINLLCWIALFATSLATVALVIDGCLSLKRDKLLPQELINGVRDSLNNGDLDAATATCQTNPSPLSRILLVGFSNIEEGYEVIQESVSSGAELENEKLLQRINYLNVCGQLGPMLGLLGTVIGMVLAFASLATAGAGKAAMLAVAISTALWTTVVGLLIAIPALLAYTMLKNYATRLILEMQATVLDLIKVLRTAEVQQQ